MKIRTYAPKFLGQVIRTQKLLTVRTFDKFTIINNSNSEEAVPSSFVARMIEGGDSSLRCLTLGKNILVLWEPKNAKV
jgi:hypothetical protein